MMDSEDAAEALGRGCARENAQLRAIVEAAKPVLFHVSRGRRAAFIDVYPDATARRALGLISEWESA